MSDKSRQSTSSKSVTTLPIAATTEFIPPEKDKETTLYGFIINQVHRFFLDNIPVESVKELPLAYVYYLGTLAYIATIALFIYFTTTNYHATMSQAFIAVDTSSGSCTSVPITITGNYLADYNGNWIGSADFVYANAIYAFSFSGFSVDSYDQYVQMMQFFKQAMYDIGEEGATHSLSYNLVLWSSFISYYSVEFPTTTNFSSIGLGQLQYIQLSGVPEQIFSTQFQAHYFIDINGTCNLEATTSYDRANGVVVAGYAAKQYASNKLCSDIAPMETFGYTSKVNAETFSVNLDVRTFATGIAVNFNYLNIAYLGKVGKVIFTFVVDGITYSFGEYFDTRYYAMKTLYCISNLTPVPTDRNSVESMCFYAQGKLLALPVFNHFGASETFPDYCFCSGVGHSQDCNFFNVMASLVYFPLDESVPSSQTESPMAKEFFSDRNFAWSKVMGLLDGEHIDVDEVLTTNTESTTATDSFKNVALVFISAQVQRLLLLVNKYPTYNTFSRSAYNASWTASSTVYGVQANVTHTQNWYDQVFNFCKISNGQTCDMEVFYLFDYISQTVSDYKYRLQNGSCVNSLTLPDPMWQKLINTPPVQLTQSYFKCYPTEDTAFLNAIGVASGNTTLAVPLLLFASLPIVYLILVILHQVPPKDEYSEEEKDEALDILSIILLRLRDGKSRGIKKDGILTNLTKELVSAAKEEGGFPDSDDDEDDDDENDAEEDENDSKKKANKESRQEAKRQKSKDEGVVAASPLVVKSVVKKTVRNANVDSDDDDEETISKSRPVYDVEHGVSEASRPARRQSAITGRRGSVQGGIAMRRDSAVRPLMGVFTKQLVAEESPCAKDQNVTKANRKMKFEMFQESERLTRSSATFGHEMVEFRKKSIAPDQVMITGSSPLHPPSESFSINTSNVDFETIKISNNNIADMHIMNELDEVHDAQLVVEIMQMETLSSNDIYDLVDQMEELFKQAVATKDELITNQATKLSYKLTSVLFTDFIALDDPAIFLKLSNILAIHASLELEIDVKDVLSMYSNNIAYNIGGKLITAARLPALCT